mmetsp:Transcript_5966/g.14768  ORF Transcript_5966/g.14768 Transcript_5966/m.14768 type:complete len:704 (-) Transcript_5966:87-2198(-)
MMFRATAVLFLVVLLVLQPPDAAAESTGTDHYDETTAADDGRLVRRRLRTTETATAATSEMRHLQLDDTDDSDGDMSVRIIGGNNAREGRWPWFVQVRALDPNGNIGGCGGALIAPDIVLSAAHCYDPTHVYIGAYDQTQFDEMTQRREVLPGEFVRHPEYVNRVDELDYDIMVIKLDDVAPSVTPIIRMNYDPSVPETTGESLIMLGYGSTTPAPQLTKPDILQEAPTKYVTNEECSTARDPTTGSSYGVGTAPGQTLVDPHWFCTIETEPVQTGTCFGDSGGPIAIEGESFNDDVLVAVISGASGGCGNPYLPLWNQRVSYHAAWVIQESCKLSTSPPPEWKCDQGGVVPQPGDVIQPTSPPVTPPTPSPTTARPTPSPTPRPSTASPTSKPTARPTESTPETPQPVTAAPITPRPTSTPPTAAAEVDPTAAPTSVAPTSEPSTTTPTISPSISPEPTITAEPTFTPFKCNICGENQKITAPNATVVVPLMGSMTCDELQADVDVPGAYDNLQCLLFQIVSLPCGCEPRSPDAIIPTPAPLSTLPPDNLANPPAQLVGDAADEDGKDEDTVDEKDVPKECRYMLSDTKVAITITIQFDQSPEDIGWYIADSQQLCYRLGVRPGAYQVGTVTMTETVPLIEGIDYVFVIESEAGDGLGGVGDSNNSLPGSYNLTAFDDIVLATGSGNFGNEEKTTFTVPKPP